jgi:hypothetical protein
MLEVKLELLEIPEAALSLAWNLEICICIFMTTVHHFILRLHSSRIVGKIHNIANLYYNATTK